MAPTSGVYLRRDQIVFAYEPAGWPEGVLTGYEQDGGFVLEYVFLVEGAPRSALVRTLSRGLQEAWDRGYWYVALAIHRNHPRAALLEQLARHFKFVCYRADEVAAYYVRYRRSRNGEGLRTEHSDAAASEGPGRERAGEGRCGGSAEPRA